MFVVGAAACGDSDDDATSVTIADGAACAFEFNEGTLAERGWVFDGTLIEFSTGADSQLGDVPTATDTGARLLVTGEPRWGGEPLDDAVAWGCGFTQPWTSSAAEQWSTAFGP